MSSNTCMINRNIKRRSEFSRTNRIRLDLFSFAKNEINENKKLHNDSFSFSNQSFEKPEEKKEKKESKFKIMNKTISLNSQKTANDSFNMSSDEEDSSEMSCDEEI